MKTKPAYQLDAQGYLTGETVADESPREPGVFLTPAGCVLKAPPAHIDGKVRRYLHGAWLYEAAPEPHAEAAPPKVARTVDQARFEKLAEVNAACAAKLALLKSPYPLDDVLSWAKQETEARAYLADKSASAPFLLALSLARGITLDELAPLVIKKADAFALISGSLIGARQRLEKLVLAAQEIADIDAIQWADPEIPPEPYIEKTEGDSQ